MIRLELVTSPNCGTCKIAERMLEITLYNHTDIDLSKISSIDKQVISDYRVESIPCLLIFKDEKLTDKIYAFKDVVYLDKYFKTLKIQ